MAPAVAGQIRRRLSPAKSPPLASSAPPHLLSYFLATTTPARPPATNPSSSPGVSSGHRRRFSARPHAGEASPRSPPPSIHRLQAPTPSTRTRARLTANPSRIVASPAPLSLLLALLHCGFARGCYPSSSTPPCQPRAPARAPDTTQYPIGSDFNSLSCLFSFIEQPVEKLVKVSIISVYFILATMLRLWRTVGHS